MVNFSFLLIKCIIGSFHQKRRNDIFRSTGVLIEGPGITNTIPRSFCDFCTLDGKSTQVYID